MSKLTARELLEEMGWPAQRLDLIPPVEDLAARVEKVLTLHSPSKFFKTPTCIECSKVTPHDWPCPTVCLLNDEDQADPHPVLYAPPRAIFKPPIG